MKIDWTKVKEGFTIMDVLKEENKELKQELQQKENIIKEVREYITSYINQFNGVYPAVDMRYLDLNKILEILDKVGDEK